jgi:hypothetical protein
MTVIADAYQAPNAVMQIAKRVHALAQEQDEPTLMIWACSELASTHYYLRDFEPARRYALHGVQIWRSGGGQPHPEEVNTPLILCLCYVTLSEWLLGEIASCHATIGKRSH